MSFGKTLRRVRKLKDKTLRDIAEAAGMDISYISRLETDSLGSKPTRETINKLAKALDCSREEHAELISAAERLDDELIKLSRIAKDRPIVGKLFHAAVHLSPEKLEELVAKFESEIQDSDQKKRKKKSREEK